MKTHLSQNKVQQKPIKYKQFIQQLQNSSRSSIQDQSILSQRSFRQSQTARNFQDQFRNQNGIKNSKKQSPFKLKDVKSSYKITNPSFNKNDKKMFDLSDKLYTFCDAKLTQRSIQIVNHSNSKSKAQQTQQRRQVQNPKYFKTNKRNEQKENIDFVNQIIQKIQSGGFQGKVLKTQNSNVQNLQKSNMKSPEPILLVKNQNTGSSSITQPNFNGMNQSSSNRKIQSVKKIFVMTKQSSNKISNKKMNKTNNMSEEKSRDNSVRKNQHQTQIQKQSQQKCSSKKKIVSLDINTLKSSVNPPNNIRVKLSLDKSTDGHNQQKQKILNMEGRTNFNISSRGSLVQAKMVSSSMQKMASLDHSKIESLHEGSRSNLLMSGMSLSQLGTFLPKEQIPNQQLQRLRNTVNEYKEKQKNFSKQIQDLNQKLKHSINGQQKRSVQILQTDCARLTNSYKQMKKLYEITAKQKEQLQTQMQTLICENNDLKECLDFKSYELNTLHEKILQMTQHVFTLQHQLQNRVCPSQFQGFSETIKQKITQYESQISSLLDENQKLTLLRQKLLNYNQTLKEEIQEKDNLIQSLQTHVKGINSLRRSCKDQIGDYRQNELRLNKLCKQFQSKLKLSNIHNEYLTQEIVSLKQEKKKLIDQNTDSNSHFQIMSNFQIMMAGGSPNYKSKFTNFNTLANTITTRNSSISHGNDQFDHFPHRIRKDKSLEKQNNCSTEQIP